MLQSILAPTRTDDAAQSIYDWEMSVTRYEQQSGDRISDTIRLATLSSHLVDSSLRAHLNLQAARLTSYELARKEVLDYIRATKTWGAGSSNDVQPMEIDALTKKGKSKGKG